MTEAEWLACPRYADMLKFWAPVAGERKLRLLACGAVRQPPVWEMAQGMRAGELVAAVERYADGAAAWGEVAAVGEAARHEIAERTRQAPPGSRPSALGRALNAAPLLAQEDAERAAWDVLAPCWGLLGAFLCVLKREITGPLPYRPVSFAAAWRTGTAIALAEQMYKARDFGAMPILADALQDAGCDNADILDHCRDPKQVHVRGCWVVDLVLGKA